MTNVTSCVVSEPRKNQKRCRGAPWGVSRGWRYPLDVYHAKSYGPKANRLYKSYNTYIPNKIRNSANERTSSSTAIVRNARSTTEEEEEEEEDDGEEEEEAEEERSTIVLVRWRIVA